MRNLVRRSASRKGSSPTSPPASPPPSPPVEPTASVPDEYISVVATTVETPRRCCTWQAASGASGQQPAGSEASTTTQQIVEQAMAPVVEELERLAESITGSDKSATPKAEEAQHEEEEEDSPGDLIGRWIVVPSYMFLMLVMLVGNGHHLFASDGCDEFEGLRECAVNEFAIEV